MGVFGRDKGHPEKGKTARETTVAGDPGSNEVYSAVSPERLRPEPVAPPPGVAAKQNALASLRQVGQMPMAPPAEPSIHCITIVGQIEGHVILPPKNKTTKYEHIMPQLVAIEQNPRIKGLLMILNTVGGDIEAGLAIAEMIASMSKPVVSLVLGGGHSIGIPIAVAADYSFIAKTATMTVHPIRLTGLVIGVPQTYEYLDKMQDRVIRFITEHSRVPEKKLRELMFRTGELMRDVGTVLVGQETVSIGLMDEIGGLEQSVRKLVELIAEREGITPEEAEMAYLQGRSLAPREAKLEEEEQPGPAAVVPISPQANVEAVRPKPKGGILHGVVHRHTSRERPRRGRF